MNKLTMNAFGYICFLCISTVFIAIYANDTPIISVLRLSDGTGDYNADYQRSSYRFVVDSSSVVCNVSRFWTSTGFCPPDPHRDVLRWILSGDNVINLGLIGSIPHSGMKQIRIHWLLDGINVSSIRDRQPVYNFSMLDNVMQLIWTSRLMPGLELMGNPSNIFTDFNNHTQILMWQELIYQLAARYIDMFGLGYVLQWNFESWNEPKLKHFDGLNMTIKGFLNYYDASVEGLRRANPLLRIGGPGGACPDNYTLDSYCWALLEHAQNGINYFTGQKDVKLDFISIHKKGTSPSNTAMLFKRELNFIYQLRLHLPLLANKSIFNDEADPEVTWSADRTWQADTYYAAMATKIIVDHQNGLNDFAMNYRLLSNDAAFLSYQPYPFTQRTLLARFQINTTTPPYTHIIRKPVYVALGLLSLLGEHQLKIDQLHDDVPTQFGNLSLLATLHQPRSNLGQDSWQLTVVVYYSDDTHLVTAQAQVTIQLNNLPNVSFNDVMYVIYYIDNIRTNPYRVWKDAGSPVTPDDNLLAKMRSVEDPVRLSKPSPWKSTSTTLIVNLPGVAVLHLCAKPTRPPDQVTDITIYNITYNQVQIIWSDTCINTKCITTYQLEYSPTGDSFRRINNVDSFFTSFVYAVLTSRHTEHVETTRGFYRIRAVDYWNRPGEYSLVVQYPTTVTN